MLKQNGQVCTDCHKFDEVSKNSNPAVVPVANKQENSSLKISGNALIQSGSPIQGGGQDCVSCHDISGNGTPPDKRIDERVGFGRGAVSLVIAGFHDPTLRYRGDNCEKIW